MALENYTKTQKIVITGLIVIIAAMFTATGAMMSVLSPSGGHRPTEAAIFEGQPVGMVEFHQIRNALWASRTLDSMAAQGNDKKDQIKPAPLYAHVPALSPLPQGGVPSLPQSAGAEVLGDVSLLLLWPQYQDTQVWCHMALARRAREANIVQPTNAQVDATVLALLNAALGDLEKTTLKKLEADYRERFGHELKEVRPVLQECIMVRNYVDSLLAGERAKLADIAAIDAGNNQEVRAEYLRLTPDVFMDEARKEVLRENFLTRARRLAVGLGTGTPASGPDLIEEMYDKVRGMHLQNEATFEFELVRADLDEMERNLPIEESRARIYYEAMKSDLYKATDADKAKIDDRLKEWANTAELTWERDNPGKPKPANADEWNKLKEEQRPKLLEFRTFTEVRPELEKSLRRDFAATLAQAALASLKSECEQEKEKRQKKLSAQSQVKQQFKANFEDLRRLRQELRSRFDAMITQINARLGDNQRRAGDAADDNALNIAAADVLRALDDLSIEQLRSLESTANRATFDMERSLKDMEAGLETLKTDTEAKGDDGEPLTDEMRKLKVEKDELKIKGLKEQMVLRDQHIKAVTGFIADMRTLLSSLALRAAATRQGEMTLRKYALEQLVVEGRLELVRVVREGRDAIAPQQALDDLDGSIQLATVEVDAFNEQMRKDSGDLSHLALDKLAADRKMTVERSRANMTWRQVLADPRLAFLEHVSGAQNFLEGPASTKGAVSDILPMPGQGLYMIRLGAKQPKYPLGALETRERVVKLAAMRRSREICVRELNRIRDEIIKDGWDAALKRAKEKYPALTVQKTEFFSDNVDLPQVFSNSDHDVLDFSASPNASTPDMPFMNRIKSIDVKEGVSEIIPEKHNTDILDRPDDEKWAYMLAHVVDRRIVDRRISEETLNEDKYSLGDIWRQRRLASSDVVRGLIEPKQLLGNVRVARYPFERESEKAKEEEEKKKKAKAGT
ncbi:MAG: hypothetical protein IT462_00100 [Planctomycetes bacterium]|nr:hypothetical protein [Planctomycetota bacterium]